MERAAAATTTVSEKLSVREPVFVQLLKSVRTYQWVKNFLVFVPPLTTQVLWGLDVALPALIIFLAFCARASGVYIINDLLDLDSDPQHPRKRERPSASGQLPLYYAGVSPVGVQNDPRFHHIDPVRHGDYRLRDLSIIYSVSLKKVLLLDVFNLASF